MELSGGDGRFSDLGNSFGLDMKLSVLSWCRNTVEEMELLREPYWVPFGSPLTTDLVRGDLVPLVRGDLVPLVRGDLVRGDLVPLVRGDRFLSMMWSRETPSL
ncbi:hypothetical protein EYF80_033185 [Liparis tanakae]|uniref:Uncharacterized protein n=1 Tax=Liparis tanakae TaxID=230148 RepID=A0A4Z2GSK4_9TELE|nr:hypothetical protein EYF80_033185 [Liparis tanakae]